MTAAIIILSILLIGAVGLNLRQKRKFTSMRDILIENDWRKAKDSSEKHWSLIMKNGLDTNVKMQVKSMFEKHFQSLVHSENWQGILSLLHEVHGIEMKKTPFKRIGLLGILQTGFSSTRVMHVFCDKPMSHVWMEREEAKLVMLSRFITKDSKGRFAYLNNALQINCLETTIFNLMGCININKLKDEIETLTQEEKDAAEMIYKASFNYEFEKST